MRCLPPALLAGPSPAPSAHSAQDKERQNNRCGNPFWQGSVSPDPVT